MPFQVKGTPLGMRCTVCGKIVVKPFLQIKTCCVNKPLIFCSKKCMQMWEAKWLREQEQIRESKIK